MLWFRGVRSALRQYRTSRSSYAKVLEADGDLTL